MDTNERKRKRLILIYSRLKFVNHIFIKYLKTHNFKLFSIIKNVNHKRHWYTIYNNLIVMFLSENKLKWKRK